VRHRPFEPSSRRLIPVAWRPPRSAGWTGVGVALLLLALTAAHAQVGAGDRLVDQGRFEEAVELAPDDPGTHFEVARALGRAAQYRGVLASLNLAARVADALDLVLEMDPDHAAAWHAHALYHHEVPWIAGGRAGRVVPSFERAIELEPDEISHRVGLAGVLIDREAYDEAARQLDVALSLTPRTYLDERDLAEARALVDRLP